MTGLPLKTFLLRLAGLVLLALAGGPLYALSVNGMLLFHLIPDALLDQDYGRTLTAKTIPVWAFSCLIGFAAIFVRDKSVRRVLYASPAYASALFALIYTLTLR